MLSFFSFSGFTSERRREHELAGEHELHKEHGLSEHKLAQRDIQGSEIPQQLVQTMQTQSYRCFQSIIGKSQQQDVESKTWKYRQNDNGKPFCSCDVVRLARTRATFSSSFPSHLWLTRSIQQIYAVAQLQIRHKPERIRGLACCSKAGLRTELGPASCWRHVVYDV